MSGAHPFAIVRGDALHVEADRDALEALGFAWVCPIASQPATAWVCYSRDVVGALSPALLRCSQSLGPAVTAPHLGAPSWRL